jgi:hypothetical protein
MSENPILMTQAEYARHRNKSPQYIGKLYKAGILVMRDRLVDVVASDAVLDDKPSEKTTMDSQAPASYPDFRSSRPERHLKLLESVRAIERSSPQIRATDQPLLRLGRRALR